MSGWGVRITNGANQIVIDQDYDHYSTIGAPTTIVIPSDTYVGFPTPHYVIDGGVPIGGFGSNGIGRYMYGSPYPTMYKNYWPGAPVPDFSMAPICFTRSPYLPVAAFPYTNGTYVNPLSIGYYAVDYNADGHGNATDIVWAVRNVNAWFEANNSTTPPSNDNWGLRIRKPNGGVAFDSRKRQVLIRDFFWANPGLDQNVLYGHKPCSGLPFYAVSMIPSGPYYASDGNDNISNVALVQSVNSSNCYVRRLRQTITDTATYPVGILVADII